METKNISLTNSRNMLFHHLKEKKNWSLLTFVILAVTVVVLPLLLDTSIREEFVVIGIIETFAIVFINCIIDFNYLHDSRKFGYYLSKPINNIKRLNITLIVNILFATFFMGLLALISIIYKLDVVEMFTIASGWLLMIIFLSGLSSYLSGNSIIAAIATWFNFAVPVIFLGVFYFAMDIVSDVAVGFNVEMMVQYIVDNIYRLDIVYLIRFAYEPNWLMYALYLALICTAIYALTLMTIKLRKNERIGQHLVFNGYKNFVALMVTMIIPFLFTTVLRSGTYVSKLIAFVILGAISYYVALVILEKTFRLRANAYKILSTFMVSFICLVMVSGFTIKQVENKVPDLADVEGVMLTSGRWFYHEESGKSVDIRDLEIEDGDSSDITIYETEEAIKAVMDIHLSILDNSSYQHYIDVNIVYFLKNGKTVRRYYTLEPFSEPYNNRLDDLSLLLERTDEFKFNKLPFIYNDAYAEKYTNSMVTLNSKGEEVMLVLTSDRLASLRDALYNDAETISESDLSNFWRAIDPWDQNYLTARNTTIEKKTVHRYGSITLARGGKNEYMDIPYNFTSTRAFIAQYIN